jgi:hypothetical protein
MSGRRALVGWKRLPMSVAIGALAAAGCGGEPVRGPEQPTPSANTGPTAVDVPTATARPRASVVPSPTAAPTSPMLILFQPLRSRPNGRGAGEVTRPDQLDDLLDRFDIDEHGLDYSPREQVEPWRALGARVLAFVLAGCANDGATLEVEPTRVDANLTGGLGVQCDAPQDYLAVFAVPAGLIADGASIG